ncbi:MAG: methylmalonyl-CoA epimerase [delta proteobacterium MLS_D]|jgi:methylmalonyl-CoA epimerase|nr:MAG: methylmalonyl-CoA epimerase [delta proteobacterium MLS_D]
MHICAVDHVGIAVRSIEEGVKIYETLGIRFAGVEDVPEQKVKTAFLPVGETEIELLESTAPDGPVAKFIETRGEGIHHIALRVNDIDEVLKELKDAGIRLIDQEPRYGAGGARIAFVHPKATGGVLIELAERGDAPEHEGGE